MTTPAEPAKEVVVRSYLRPHQVVYVFWMKGRRLT
jgi:hypothetical protein